MSRARLLRAGLALAALLAPGTARATQITVLNFDGAGEGLSDPTPFTPVGGNNATTLGAARLAALQRAADLWAQQLDSSIEIEISANFDPLTCTQTSAVLGQTGATTVHRDFPSAPQSGVWYVQALANSLARTDLDPANPDMHAQFNSTLDGGGCVGGHQWYYGFDGNAPVDRIDFLTVALHELAHGLGFQTFVDLATGAKLMSFDDAFMVKLEQHGATPSAYPDMMNAQRVAASESDPQLQWTGGALDALGVSILTAGTASGHVRMYGPATQAPGSSVSHFSTALSPNDLMEPFNTGTNHDTSLAAKLLEDTGWHRLILSVPGMPFGAGLALVLALGLAGASAVRRRPR